MELKEEKGTQGTLAEVGQKLSSENYKVRTLKQLN